MIEFNRSRYESSLQLKSPDEPKSCEFNSMSTADSLSLTPEESQSEEAVHDYQTGSFAADSECDLSRNSRKRDRIKDSDILRSYHHDLLETSKGIDRWQGIFTSDLAYRVYLVLVVSFLLQRPWILQGVSVVIIFKIMKLLFSWFMFVKNAKEIRKVRRLALWWIKFGLDFSTKTIEGETLHRILTAFSLNFWNSMGKSYALNLFNRIGKEQRERILLQAKQNLNRSKMTHMKFRRILQGEAESQ
jgi:hypothetical protein